MYSKKFHMVLISWQFFKELVMNIFLEQLLGKYTSPELDPVLDLVVKIPDPAKSTPAPDPQHCPIVGSHHVFSRSLFIFFRYCLLLPLFSVITFFLY
jgi:hypothetical protein